MSQCWVCYASFHQAYIKRHFAECHHIESCNAKYNMLRLIIPTVTVLNVFMVSAVTLLVIRLMVIIQSVIILNVILMSAIMLNVIILSVI